MDLAEHVTFYSSGVERAIVPGTFVKIAVHLDAMKSSNQQLRVPGSTFSMTRINQSAVHTSHES